MRSTRVWWAAGVAMWMGVGCESVPEGDVDAAGGHGGQGGSGGASDSGLRPRPDGSTGGAGGGAGGMDAGGGGMSDARVGDALPDLDAGDATTDALPDASAPIDARSDMVAHCPTGPDERCNGADDDCDGVTDEGFPGLGEPCTSGAGACASSGRTVCTADGLGVACDAVAAPAAPEQCNDLDDDCDGATDESLTERCFDGPAEAAGVGICRAGMRTCEHGVFGACAGMVPPTDEVCDGLDGDCDGRIDEGTDVACYDGPPGTAGVGPCAAGTRACVDGSPDACIGQVLPALEICDGIDDDCDGNVDEGLDCACLPGTVQPCYAGPDGSAGVGSCRPGHQTCLEDGSAFGPCVDQVLPAAESCNGLDDDCNGTADDVEGVDEPCSLGVGTCAAPGSRFCDLETGELRCDAAPGAPAQETCNAQDDDCDGRADEEFRLGAACTVGIGACEAAGQVVCDGAGAVTCSVAPGSPRDEVCNEIDDDCDGEVDEELGLGEACEVGRGICAAAGTTVCSADGSGRVVCDAVAGAPRDEECNNLDDDCDGAVDEQVTRGCYAGPAGTAGVGACREGVSTCVGGEFSACDGELLPSDEACNGRDDDCDGSPDEGLVRPCYDGPEGTSGVGLCGAGVQSCRDGAYGECEGSIVPAVEGCDARDEDCDGDADEDVTRACYSGVDGTAGVGVCRQGTSTCAAGEFGACAGEVVPAAESCDGEDDDCDGDADEETERACYGGPAGTLGVGRCRGGVDACADGAYRRVCDGEVLPAAEVCNLADDDCDGIMDENTTRSCYGGPAETADVGTCRSGVQTCVGGGYGACDGEVRPAVEVCDGRDEDCDGRTDEGLDCVQISTGTGHTCALFGRGRLKCWGLNAVGQLGIGDTTARGDHAGEMGVSLPFVNFGAERTIEKVFAGGWRTCAVLDTGALKCWGYNLNGELGLGDTAYRGDGPNEIGENLPAVDLGARRTARSASLSMRHTCAVLDDGAVKCWGDNGYGQLGIGSTTRRGARADEMGDDLPAVSLGAGRSAVSVSVGRSHSCALLDDATVKCWGYNLVGQLGLGDTRDRGDQPGELGDALPAVDLGSGRRAVAVSAGGNHTCALLDNDAIKCWGTNAAGELGLGDAAARGDNAGEMGDALPAIDLGAGRTATAIAAGGRMTCALLDNATVKCWGRNHSGSLGLGDAAIRGDQANEMGDNLPSVPLGAGRTVRNLAVALTRDGFELEQHVCAVLDNATVKCWGDNIFGQLGLGNNSDRGDQANEMGDALPAVQLE